MCPRSFRLPKLSLPYYTATGEPHPPLSLAPRLPPRVLRGAHLFVARETPHRLATVQPSCATAFLAIDTDVVVTGELGQHHCVRRSTSYPLHPSAVARESPIAEAVFAGPLLTLSHRVPATLAQRQLVRLGVASMAAQSAPRVRGRVKRNPNLDPKTR